MNMRKGLLIGINKYHDCSLNCCINDVNELNKVLSVNSDNTKNFHNSLLLDEEATRANIRRKIKDLFSGTGDVALLYFSGHGFDDKNDGFIVSYDYENDDWGIKMTEIIKEANASKINYKIIILDCCHSGFMGNYGIIGDTSYLGDGVVILTACRNDEVAMEVNDHGVFTNLLIEALNGGACDILGNVTPGTVYSYIDQALGPWIQRPLFKANINSFISLRRCNAKIEISELKKIVCFFKNDNEVYTLDPSYEKTNIQGCEYKNKPPYAIAENVEKMTILQKYNRNGLLIPYGATDMYFAAMDNKGCILTPLGKHYYKMIKEEVI